MQKLNLAKETLASLDQDQTQDVQGGFIRTFTCNVIVCRSGGNCTSGTNWPQGNIC